MSTFIRRHSLLFTIILIAIAIRLYHLGSIPISLHGDEAGVGYNAYALLTAGIDEYGKPWPLVLRADVAPLIFYATIPSITFFGLTEFATRFPSVVIGVISIAVFYILIKKLFNEKVALISTSLFSLSPWHIHISRITHDASYGLLLQLIATVFFLKGKLGKTYFMLLSFIFFGISFYSYHSPRLTSPLLILGLLFVFRKEVLQMKKRILYGLILFGIIILPITLDFISKPIGETRIGGISIFTREDTSIPITPLYFVRLIPTFVHQYINQFNPISMFFDTSSMRYFNVSSVGLLYVWQIILIPIGIIFVLRKKKREALLILWWVLIAALPGSLTKGGANAGRIFMLLPMLSVLSGVGLLQLIEKVKQKRTICSAMLSVGLINVLFFLYQYFIDSPTRFSSQWNYGAKEMAQEVLQKESQYENIIITNQIREGYIYILFYGAKDPRWLATIPDKKRNSFIGYDRFGKYEFRTIDWSVDATKTNALIIATPEETPRFISPLIRIYGPNKATLFNLVTTKML